MTIRWLLTDNSEPVEFDGDLNPLPRQTMEIASEQDLQNQFFQLMTMGPHVVVLRSMEGGSIVVGVGPELGWITCYPTKSEQAYTFLPRVPFAKQSLEFRSEAGMAEVLPQHLLPTSDVIQLLQLLCFHNVVPCLAGEPASHAAS
jgi:hypothetical protein